MQKPYPIYDQNGQNRYPIYDQNSWKTIPFGAAHTYIAHIREYPPPPGPISHKAMATKTLTRRAQLVCETPDSLRGENKYLELVFIKNNYNAAFIRRNIFRPTEADATNKNPTPVTTVTIPYIDGTSKTISRILKPYNVRVAQKPVTTLRHLKWPTLKTEANPTTGREQFTRSNAPTARLPTLVRLAETLTRDWLNTNEPREMVMPTITLLCISTDKPQHWLGPCSMLNLQYKLFSTINSGKLVH